MSLINPLDSIERQNEKLLLISKVLMRRVEQKNEQSGLAYAQFERAALLEMQVKERTIDLERTLDLLQESNAQLEEANRETETARTNLGEAIETINEGFALFDSNDLLVLFNSRFCRDMKDVEMRLVEGLAFNEYVDLVSRSSSLALPPDVTPAKWASRRKRAPRMPTTRPSSPAAPPSARASTSRSPRSSARAPLAPYTRRAGATAATSKFA